VVVPIGKGFIGPVKKQVTVWVSRCGGVSKADHGHSNSFGPQQKLSKTAYSFCYRMTQTTGSGAGGTYAARRNRLKKAVGDVTMGRVMCWVTATRVLLKKRIRSAAAANGMRGVEPR
jgi:hypothetical protein